MAQLSQLPAINTPDFIKAAGQAEDVIKRVGAGSVLWVSDPKQMNRLQHIAMDQSRLHIPILFGLDVIHGYHISGTNGHGLFSTCCRHRLDLRAYG